MKQTMFGHFLWCETIAEPNRKLAKKLRIFLGSKYSRSFCRGKQEWRELIIRTQSEEIYPDGWWNLPRPITMLLECFKVTGLGDYIFMEKSKLVRSWMQNEGLAFERTQASGGRLCKAAHDLVWKILVDMLKSLWFQEMSLTDSGLHCQWKKNIIKKRCVVYIHFRCIDMTALERLKESKRSGEGHGDNSFGAKPVRGAYMEKRTWNRAEEIELFPSPNPTIKLQQTGIMNLALKTIAWKMACFWFQGSQWQ